MADEATLAPDYRALCDALGWPPIAGAAPEDEESPEGQETPPAAPEEGTPAPEPEAPASGDPEIDYRKRFEDLQPELTKAQQANAELRRLFEAAQRGDSEALEALGIEFEEEEEFDEFDDPTEALKAEVAQLKEHLSTRESREQEAQLREQEVNYIHGQLEGLEKEAGVELTDGEVDFIVDRACMDRDEGNAPNVKGAFESFNSLLDAKMKRYLESKKNAPAAPVGGPGEETIDLSDAEQRQRAMVRDIEAEGSE